MEPVTDARLYSNRYQVTHLIARGGMAMVYRAQDRLLNRPVAIKILYPELSEDPLFVERFRREAQAAANLSHPNIVPIFDWGEDDNTYFIVMELVEGTSLAEILRDQGTLTPARSANVAAQVASALGYAHRAGMVHRDIKPGNILITSEGLAKVTDFGIAQAVSSHDALTEEGLVMGTATYFSPEQAEGVAVDGRSDVYSLGVVMYQMLVGRPPFAGENPADVAYQHVHSVVAPLSNVSSSVPSDLEAIVMESLEKSPAQRYQSADELRADLLRFNEGQPVRAAPQMGAFYGADATRAVSAVAGGERTQAVPIMTGPRTDVRRRRRNWIPALVISLVVLLLAAGVGALLLANRHQVTVMPSLVGETINNATQTLRNDGLGIVSTNLVQSSKPSGTIIATTPKAGAKVDKGQSVQLKVSIGQTSTPVTVPSTTGMALSDAESTLQSRQLSVKVDFTSTAPQGATPDTVLSQIPSGGTKVQSGDTVTITVLSPSSKFALPDVSGQTTTQAAQILGQSQLVVASRNGTICSNTVPQGDVVSTLPPAGSLVASGDSVRLNTSNGVCQVVVPSVLNDTQSQATSTLQAQSFLAAYQSADPSLCQPGQGGLVVSQTPSPGLSAKYGSTVQLQICPTSGPTTGPTTNPPG